MADQALLSLKVPPDLLPRLDRHAKRLSAATPGVVFSRAMAVRSLLAEGLDAAEQREREDQGQPHRTSED
jgi:hypothetical protein